MYGSYNLEKIRELWRDLTRIEISLNEPWLLQGDFNAVCSNADKIGGNHVNEEAANDFQNWNFFLDLIEVQYNGSKFTWTNFQEGERRIFRKLDWCFANQSWYKNRQDPVCYVLNCNVFDYCGILVDIKQSTRMVNAPFRFFNM